MDGDGDVWHARFPELFRDSCVDYGDCHIRYTPDAVPQELVSRLHLIA